MSKPCTVHTTTVKPDSNNQVNIPPSDILLSVKGSDDKKYDLICNGKLQPSITNKIGMQSCYIKSNEPLQLTYGFVDEKLRKSLANGSLGPALSACKR